jgi:hypothetical protein
MTGGDGGRPTGGCGGGEAMLLLPVGGLTEVPRAVAGLFSDERDGGVNETGVCWTATVMGGSSTGDMTST